MVQDMIGEVDALRAGLILELDSDILGRQRVPIYASRLVA